MGQLPWLLSGVVACFCVRTPFPLSCVCVFVSKKKEKDSKLKFYFVIFQYKLNCLDFFSELMNIFFIMFLLRYFVYQDLKCNKL